MSWDKYYDEQRERELERQRLLDQWARENAEARLRNNGYSVNHGHFDRPGTTLTGWIGSDGKIHHDM